MDTNYYIRFVFVPTLVTTNGCAFGVRVCGEWGEGITGGSRLNEWKMNSTQHTLYLRTYPLTNTHILVGVFVVGGRDRMCRKCSMCACECVECARAKKPLERAWFLDKHSELPKTPNTRHTHTHYFTS